MVEAALLDSEDPVVLCCAKADQSVIQQVAGDLESQGCVVQLVVNARPETLATVVERLKGYGLYVLCRSPAFPDNTIERLRKRILGEQVPFTRTLTVAANHPDDVRRRITKSLHRIAASRARRGLLPPPSAVPMEIEDGTITRPIRLDNFRARRLEGQPATTATAPAVRPRFDERPRFDDRPFDRAGVPIPVRTGKTAIVIQEAVRSGVTVRIALEPLPEHDYAGSGSVPAATRRAAQARPIAQVTPQSDLLVSSWLLWSGMAITAVVIAMVAISIATRPKATDLGPASVATASTVEGPGNPPGSVEEPWAGHDGRRPGELSTLVMDALRKRKIRALDVLLVTTDAAGPMSSKAATAYCQSLDVEGLTDWRLPDVGELNSLSRSGMLGDEFFWSRTPADTFGDARLAWWSKGRQAFERLDDARAVCVRTTQPHEP